MSNHLSEVLLLPHVLDTRASWKLSNDANPREQESHAGAQPRHLCVRSISMFSPPVVANSYHGD